MVNPERVGVDFDFDIASPLGTTASAPTFLASDPPMLDLLAGCLIILAVSACVAWATWRFARRASKRTILVAVLVAGAAALAYAFFLHGELALARWIPSSAAIVLTNAIPIGLAVLIGAVAANCNIPAWRRVVLVVLLAGLGVFALVHPLDCERRLPSNQPRELQRRRGRHAPSPSRHRSHGGRTGRPLPDWESDAVAGPVSRAAAQDDGDGLGR
jgi:hypothetical protein